MATARRARTRGTTRTLYRFGPLGRKRNGKVAGILRRVSCGVKRKDTIPSRSVPDAFAHLILAGSKQSPHPAGFHCRPALGALS
jgi:hypothetical protein